MPRTGSFTRPATQLSIFAKYWEPGHVKTRLAAECGEALAATIAGLFLQTLLIRCDGIARRQCLVFAPANAAERFASSVPGTWELTPQADGDLGQRLAAHLQTALDSPSSRVVVIGSDSPNLPRSYLADAFQWLKRVPVVLGPTSDGGYYLLGVRDSVPPIFSEMPWSTPELLTRTIERLNQAGCPYHLLPPWYDVDQWPDLLRLRRDLQQASEPCHENRVSPTGSRADPADCDDPLNRLARELQRLLGPLPS